jgi:hypothetical protein
MRCRRSLADFPWIRGLVDERPRGPDRSPTHYSAGLKVRARLDRGDYPRGIKVSDKELKAVPLTPHEFHGEWNYTIGPGPVP